MKKITLIALLVTSCIIGFGQKKSGNNISAGDTAYPTIHIVKEPRFILNVHSGYALGMGSTFKFYPDDISSIVVKQNGNDPAAKNSHLF